MIVRDNGDAAGYCVCYCYDPYCCGGAAAAAVAAAVEVLELKLRLLH